MAGATTTTSVDFGGTGGNGLEIVRILQSLTDQAVQESIKRRWRIVVPGKVKKMIIVRDLLGKLTKWLDTFVKIARNDFDKFGFVLEGTELIARVIGRSAIFEDLYLSDAYQARDKLQESLLQLYTTILVYLSKAQRYYRQNTLTRVLKSAFIVENTFKELLESIDTMESAMSRYSTLIDTEIRNNNAHHVRGLSLASQSNHEKMKELLNKMTEPVSHISRSLVTIEDYLEQSKRLEILDWISTQPYTSYHCQAYSAEPERSNPEVVLASIARQLACSKPGSPVLPPAETNYQDARLTGSFQKHLDLDKSCELILQLVDYHDMTTIVIDALDECDKKSR
ncbi:MAG: hypothetical protein LQ349_006281, partial [Xanthoria aureola]